MLNPKNHTIDMESFLKKQDLIFDDVRYKGGFYTDKEVFHLLTKCYRREWDDSVFIGNGMTGASIYKLSPKVTMWEIGRNDATAHNMLQGIDWATPRVPIGNILLETDDDILNETMRIHLYSAYVSGTITTKSGTLKYKTYTPKGQSGIAIEIACPEDFSYKISVQPRHGISDRIYFSGKKVDLSLLPPLPYVSQQEDLTTSVQEFVTDKNGKTEPEGALCLAWKEQLCKNGSVFYISVHNGDDKTQMLKKAITETQSFFEKRKDIKTAHKKWWANYYGQSYISISDKEWEQFYWIQMYKIACSIDEKGVVLDSQGPFMTTTTWPTTVWNLNVQLSYSPIFISNHSELVNSLISVFKNNKQVLIDNAKPMGINDGMYLSRATSSHNLFCLWPDTYELGNILWALFIIDKKEKYTGDENLVREILHPYLKMSINACRTLFETDANGIIHIKDTSSPEYPSVDGANWHPIYDCTYTLSLLHWAVQRVIELDETYGINDDLKATWLDIKKHLAPCPVDENGYMIGSDVPFAKSHRHYSHLLMIFPLATIDFTNEKEQKLAIKSIEHWLSLEKRVQGYTYTGAASMMAYLKKGDKALEYLNGLKDFLCPNTMYSEFAPVIETPISAAESIHGMLLQSHGKAIEPLPAVPSTWQDVEFANLLCEDGFAVSAKQTNSKVVEISVQNLRGNDTYIKLPPHAKNMKCSHAIIDDTKGVLKINLPINEIAIFTSEK